MRWLPLATCAGLLACQPSTDCDDRCGEGTVCEAGKCVVAPAEAEPEAEPAEDEPRKRGRRRRKGRRGKNGDADAAATEMPTFNDSRVPKYNPNRGSAIAEGAGSDRIADRTIRQVLSRNESKLNSCIDQLAAAGADIPSGKVSFEIGIDPNGRVWGVTASAPQSMKSIGLIACMRLKLSKYKFPSWDGPPIPFEYSFEVG